MWLSGKVVKKCFDARKNTFQNQPHFMTSSLVNTCTINAFEEVLNSTFFIVTARLEVNVLWSIVSLLESWFIIQVNDWAGLGD